MLQVENGKVSFKGTRMDLMAELCCLIHELNERDVFIDADIAHKMVDLAFLTDKQAEQRAKECVKQKMKDLDVEKMSPTSMMLLLGAILGVD